MKHEIRHYAYRPTLGGRSVPGTDMINDLNEAAVNYIGSFSEFNPIAAEYIVGGGTLALYVRKESSESINQQKEFRVPGLEPSRGLSYHGSDFNNNDSFELTKQQLLQIAHAMDDTDTLQIAVFDEFDDEVFSDGIEKVTGC